jgi:hypothetical protein
MLRNKRIPAAFVNHSYHEHILNHCSRHPHLSSIPKEQFYLSDLKQINVISLWLSGYIDRLQYAEHDKIDDYLDSVHEIIRVVDRYVLTLKALSNEISHHKPFLSSISKGSPHSRN